jgi:chromosome segregation ATPase
VDNQQVTLKDVFDTIARLRPQKDLSKEDADTLRAHENALDAAYNNNQFREPLKQLDDLKKLWKARERDRKGIQEMAETVKTLQKEQKNLQMKNEDALKLVDDANRKLADVTKGAIPPLVVKVLVKGSGAVKAVVRIRRAGGSL